MDGVNALDLLAHRAEQSEKGEAEQLEAELSPEEPEVDPPASPEAIDAGANRAESFMRICEGGVQLFLDDRIALSDEEIQASRDQLGPALAKHNLAGTGTGNIPYQEEVTAGFFLGRMIKRLVVRLRQLRRSDQEEAKKKEQQWRQSQHGQEPQHQVRESSQPVPGEVGLREESDVAPPIVN